MNNRNICQIFQTDHSLSKYQKSLIRKRLSLTESIIEKNRQIARKEIKQSLDFLYSRNGLLKKLIENQKILNLNLSFYDEGPIIRIQSHIRRYLCQKSYEMKKLQFQEDVSKKAIAEMALEVNNKLMIGDSTQQAISLIIKNFKIFLWRKRVKRIKLVFENYYLKSTKTFLTVFTDLILCWSSRNKIEYAKFLRFRKKRLKEIREKLAIISIKNAIKQKKFSLQSGKILYQRLRRRRKRLLTNKSDAKTSNELSDFFSNFNMAWLLEDMENDEISDHDLIEKQQNLILSKVAYGIKESPQVYVAPVLGRKTCFTPGKSTASGLSETQKYRNLIINTPPLAPQKRMFFNSELPSRLMANPYHEKARPRPLSCSGKVSNDKNFLKPTEVFMRKYMKEEPILLKVRKSRPKSRRKSNSFSFKNSKHEMLKSH